MLRCVCKLCPHAAPHSNTTKFTLHRAAPQVKYPLNFHEHQKKISSLAYDIQKIDIRGIILESFQKSCSLKPCQNICFLNICRYKKKLMPKFEPFKKLISGESIWGPLGGGGTSILCQTICCLNIYQYKPKIITLA